MISAAQIVDFLRDGVVKESGAPTPWHQNSAYYFVEGEHGWFPVTWEGG